MPFLKKDIFKNKYMKTFEESQKIYDYETKRIKEYQDKFFQLIKDLEDKEALVNLFMWYGNANSIKSKAYQEIKMHKMTSEKLEEVIENYK
jgi:ribonucleotide reductase alpha subunit